MQDKTTIHMVPEPRKTELVNACYPIIGAIFEVYKTLGPGLPEYIYQEALLNELPDVQGPAAPSLPQDGLCRGDIHRQCHHRVQGSDPTDGEGALPDVRLPPRYRLSGCASRQFRHQPKGPTGAVPQQQWPDRSVLICPVKIFELL